MSIDFPDIVDLLAGISPEDRFSHLRSLRAQARSQTQKSFLDLFQPQNPVSAGFSIEERFLVAVFVAELHWQPEISAFYSSHLPPGGEVEQLLHSVKEEARQAEAEGPYGRYPEGPLSREDETGRDYHPLPSVRDRLGSHLSSALVHAHFLTFRPRDASPVVLKALLDAGWSSTDIVTLSQLVSFLTYQIRVIIGLRTLVQASAHHAA